MRPFSENTSIETVQYGWHYIMGSGKHSRQSMKQRRAKALPAKGTSPRVKRQKRSGWQKKAAGLRPENFPSRVAGLHTLQEILSQPATWLETARQFRDDSKLVKIFQSFSSQEPWLFVACGSSYYLSQTIAAQWRRLFPAPCTAVPGSEFLFAPDEILKRTAARQAVLLSRSGKTTEVLRAAELLKTKNSIRTLGVTCNAHSALEALCTETLKLPWTDERSMVMTRSFTSILLLFESMGAKFTGDAGFASALDGLPEKTARWLDTNVDKIRALGTNRKFADFVFLGQGAHYWLAQEAALKMTEMSSSYAQAYHTLEFRHGPKSIASWETLVTFLLSDAAMEEELPLIGELKKLGAATLVVANRATQELRRNSDLLIELGLDEPEYARMAMTAIPAQILGLAVGLRKGLNPDIPKNLTRAVVLGPNGKVLAKRRSN